MSAKTIQKKWIDAWEKFLEDLENFESTLKDLIKSEILIIKKEEYLDENDESISVESLEEPEDVCEIEREDIGNENAIDDEEEELEFNEIFENRLNQKQKDQQEQEKFDPLCYSNYSKEKIEETFEFIEEAKKEFLLTKAVQRTKDKSIEQLIDELKEPMNPKQQKAFLYSKIELKVI